MNFRKMMTAIDGMFRSSLEFFVSPMEMERVKVVRSLKMSTIDLNSGIIMIFIRNGEYNRMAVVGKMPLVD